MCVCVRVCVCMCVHNYICICVCTLVYECLHVCVCVQGGTGRPGVAPPSTDTRLFQVRGTSELNTKATEVPARASSLNTNDVFLLKTPATSYLWYGKVSPLSYKGEHRSILTVCTSRF